MTDFRACNVCERKQPELLYRKDGFAIVRCAGCGLVYTGEDPAQIDFAQLYGEAYYTGGSDQVFADYIGQEAARRASARRKLWGLRLRKSSGRLLDVGCAAGFFLAEARRYFEVSGVELSEFSSRHAREKLQLNVITGTLQSAQLPADHFDVVTLWDVIEHVPDPVAVLADAARVLKPGGLLVLTTGDVHSRQARRKGRDWSLMTPPWHLYFFSRATMAAAGQRAGLRRTACSSRGVVSDRPWMQRRLGLVATNVLGLGDIMQMSFTK